MKKLFTFLLFLYAWHANAQNNVQLTKAFTPGVELGIPSNSIYSIGLGVSGKLEFPIASPVSFTITGGYDAFFHKGNLYTSSRTPSAATFMPLKAGLKYNFRGGVYIEGEMGTVIETNYSKKDLFAFSIGPGFTIPVSDNHGVDIGFRYERWSDSQLRQTAIRFAYRFGW